MSGSLFPYGFVSNAGTQGPPGARGPIGPTGPQGLQGPPGIGDGGTEYDGNFTGPVNFYSESFTIRDLSASNFDPCFNVIDSNGNAILSATHFIDQEQNVSGILTQSMGIQGILNVDPSQIAYPLPLGTPIVYISSFDGDTNRLTINDTNTVLQNSVFQLNSSDNTIRLEMDTDSERLSIGYTLKPLNDNVNIGASDNKFTALFCGTGTIDRLVCGTGTIDRLQCSTGTITNLTTTNMNSTTYNGKQLTLRANQSNINNEPRYPIEYLKTFGQMSNREVYYDREETVFHAPSLSSQVVNTNVLAINPDASIPVPSVQINKLGEVPMFHVNPNTNTITMDGTIDTTGTMVLKPNGNNALLQCRNGSNASFYTISPNNTISYTGTYTQRQLNDGVFFNIVRKDGVTAIQTEYFPTINSSTTTLQSDTLVFRTTDPVKTVLIADENEVDIFGNVVVNGSIFPQNATTPVIHDLGANVSTQRWRTIFLVNQPNVSSSREIKDDIQPLSYGLDYIKKLQPRQYRMKDDPNKEQHWGFVVDEVEQCTPVETAFLQENGLQYCELISPIVKSIQELDEKISKCKTTSMSPSMKSRIDGIEKQQVDILSQLASINARLHMLDSRLKSLDPETRSIS